MTLISSCEIAPEDPSYILAGLSWLSTLKLMRPHYSRNACSLMIEQTSPGSLLRHSKSSIRSKEGPLTACWEISTWALSVHLDDTVPERYVSWGVLVRKLIAKEFRQALHLKLMDLIKIKPAAATWNHIRRSRIIFHLFTFSNCI